MCCTGRRPTTCVPCAICTPRSPIQRSICGDSVPMCFAIARRRVPGRGASALRPMQRRWTFRLVPTTCSVRAMSSASACGVECPRRSPEPSLQKAQDAVSGALEPQFRNAHVSVTVARLRTVRIYVVGDVQRPGAYDISSMSTPLNALYAAGGPTGIGSLRIVRHFRGAQLVREVDLYDFLLHGLRMDDERLQSGDTLLVP